MKVWNWLTANELSLNIKKSSFVIFRPYPKKINHQVNLTMFDYRTNSFIPSEKKEYVNYLGVIIDSNLTWKYHRTYYFKI